MKTARTTRVAAALVGSAVVIGAGVAPSAVAATAATAAPAQAAAAAHAATVRRDGPWERAVYAQLNAARKAARMRPVSVDTCVSTAAAPLAARSARARRAVAVTAADRAHIRACFRGHDADIETVWGAARGSAAAWITAARRAAPVVMTKPRNTGGVAVYRATNGVPYVALVQVTVK